ncbi:hypothetical protein [Acuticoccus kandeliae]|uniref:hypothetical protein n=1 Tax=Acuticoccus kandeliae TaxID=2073160 RepID=UPI000D3E6A3B|nr:hypothetical protein [Acuticoccus kandeliae]
MSTIKTSDDAFTAIGTMCSHGVEAAIEDANFREAMRWARKLARAEFERDLKMDQVPSAKDEGADEHKPGARPWKTMEHVVASGSMNPWASALST